MIILIQPFFRGITLPWKSWDLIPATASKSQMSHLKLSPNSFGQIQLTLDVDTWNGTTVLPQVNTKL